jgi:hypothetical protein
MSDQGPQQPSRGRRGRGSVDPGPAYPDDQPRREYPPQYPDLVPGQRSQAAPEGSRGFREYPAPPGTGGSVVGDPAHGAGPAAPTAGKPRGYGPRPVPGESSPGYPRVGGPGESSPGHGRPRPSGEAGRGYGRGGSPGDGTRGYQNGPAAGSGTWDYGRPAAPDEAPGYARPVPGSEPGRGRRRAGAPDEPTGYRRPAVPDPGPGYPRPVTPGEASGYDRSVPPADAGLGRRRATAPGEDTRGYRQEPGRAWDDPGPDWQRGRDDLDRAPGRRREQPAQPPDGGRERRGHRAGREAADRVVEGRVVSGTAPAPARGEFYGRSDFLVPGPDDAAGSDSHPAGNGRGKGRGLFGRRSRDADPEPDQDDAAKTAGAASPAPPERAARATRQAQVPGDHSVPPGPNAGAYLSAPGVQARPAGSPEAPWSSQPVPAAPESPEGVWSSAPRRGRRHRPEPESEAALESAVWDQPAERTGPRRHGRRPGDSGAGWDTPPPAGPDQAPAAVPPAGARATSGQTGSGRTGPGPIPSGWASPEPEPVGAGRRGVAGFVADPEFDFADRGAADPVPTGRTAGRPASGRSAAQSAADPRGADEVPASRRPRGRSAVREAPRDHAAEQAEIAPAAGRSARASRPGRRAGRGRNRKIMIGAGLAVVLAGGAVAAESGVFGGGPAHVLTTPAKLGSYVRRPQLEKQMNAAQLQREVVTKSAGQASHVVSAVYEDGTSATSTQPPQMILFIGGNLSGVSAGGFIASFTQQSKDAFVTSAGSLGGSAACVNAQASVPGSVALCTWADDDTFGVVASPTMTATRLAAQLRAIRPMVEHVAK